jgi:glycosyltransferase involved in cell wall biosynthesis
MATGKKTIILVTDAWEPQTYGVVTTYRNILEALPKDQRVVMITPNDFMCWNLPFYKEIKIPKCSKKMMKAKLEDIFHQCGRSFVVHIATEGVLGFQAKRVLDEYSIPYTTAYHSKFPEFIQRMLFIPAAFIRPYFNWFHKKSRKVLMSSKSVCNRHRGWRGAVIPKGFASYFTVVNKPKNEIPVLLYVGRISKEKNIEAFLNIKLMFPHKKVVAGDGPILKSLMKKYPDVEFVGKKFGYALAEYYQSADVFVFPSKTDTFGLVVLEAMACGTPVAAYYVDGSKDQISDGFNGIMCDDLTKATLLALDLATSRQSIRERVANLAEWKESASQFLYFLGIYP